MMHDGFGALSFSSGVVNRMDQERIKSEVYLLISFLMCNNGFCMV